MSHPARRLLLLAGLLPAAPTFAAPYTASFTLTGAVTAPQTETAATLASPTLAQASESVSYKAGGNTVNAQFTGPTLWSTINSAGLTTVVGAKNSTLRDVVVVTGSDGYAAAFSAGELNPSFGGGGPPVLVATTENGAPLVADGFARVTAPKDAAGGRYVSNIANINVVQAPNNPSAGGGTSSSFTLSGLVAKPTTYTLASLSAMAAVTETVTYSAGGGPVTDSYTGVTLWSLLTAAGLLTDPAIKNDELRYYVLATGSDGYEATFSLGELDPAFGGSYANPDLVAYSDVDGQFGPGGNGFARLVVPGDAAGGRYVSNLVSLQVIDATATAVPEPATLLLLGLPLGLLGLVARRRQPAAAAA